MVTESERAQANPLRPCQKTARLVSRWSANLQVRISFTHERHPPPFPLVPNRREHTTTGRPPRIDTRIPGQGTGAGGGSASTGTYAAEASVTAVTPSATTNQWGLQTHMDV